MRHIHGITISKAVTNQHGSYSFGDPSKAAIAGAMELAGAVCGLVSGSIAMATKSKANLPIQH